MYHIKNDKRCIKSAARIGDALKELLAVKPLNRISVTDIQKVSGTGRSTFYRLFDTTDDVLLYIAEEEFSGTMKKFREMDWTGFTEYLISNIMSESQMILNVSASGKMHLISKALRNNMIREAAVENYEFDNNSKYMIAIFIGGCISLVSAWDETGRKEAVEELAKMMQKACNYETIEKTLTRPFK